MKRFGFGKKGEGSSFVRGAVASVLALCLAAAAAFTACSDKDDEVAEIWNGYFVTQDTDGNLNCGTEEMKVTFKDLSGGFAFRLDIRFHRDRSCLRVHGVQDQGRVPRRRGGRGVHFAFLRDL